MGACIFHASYKATTAREAYNALVQQALYQYGHDPYNGSISTTSGFRMITAKPDETPRDTCIRAEDLTEKRGDCACWEDPEHPGLWHFTGWAAE